MEGIVNIGRVGCCVVLGWGKGEVAHMNAGRWAETNGAKLFRDKWRVSLPYPTKCLGESGEHEGQSELLEEAGLTPRLDESNSQIPLLIPTVS